MTVPELESGVIALIISKDKMELRVNEEDLWNNVDLFMCFLFVHAYTKMLNTNDPRMIRLLVQHINENKDETAKRLYESTRLKHIYPTFDEFMDGWQSLVDQKGVDQ